MESNHRQSEVTNIQPMHDGVGEFITVQPGLLTNVWPDGYFQLRRTSMLTQRLVCGGVI